jgi:predicted PurR-regulated permease PerM
MEASPRIANASYVLAAVALLIVLFLHLLPAMVAGLMVYTIVGAVVPMLERKLSGERSRQLAVAFLAAIVAVLLALLIVGAVALLRAEFGDPDTLFNGLMPVIDRARGQMPTWIVAHLPVDTEGLRTTATGLARKHSAELQIAGKATVLVFGRILIGLILGAMVALAHEQGPSRSGPLRRELSARCAQFARAFHAIVFAQGKIAAINTAFTMVFLLVALPLAGIHLPFAKTLVIITFLVGFLPVVGNLISNTLILLVALSVSMGAAIAALVFLLLLHKFEYFLNARIIGGQIRAHAWELLLAMLVMEAAFGLPGVVAAPIYYAYLKSELQTLDLV